MLSPAVSSGRNSSTTLDAPDTIHDLLFDAILSESVKEVEIDLRYQPGLFEAAPLKVRVSKFSRTYLCSLLRVDWFADPQGYAYSVEEC